MGHQQLCVELPFQAAMKTAMFAVAAILATTAVLSTAQPIPAANLPEQCHSIEHCCMPTPYVGTPGIRSYVHDEPGSLQWRTRRPAHLLTDWETRRLERAFALLRELPDSDPRSLFNQMNLHCLYCDDALYYPGQKYPLEIHNGWFFLPWHRMYIYWFERILAKLVDDDTFALPYWAWDNSLETEPLANTIPLAYANPNSSLYDVNRNNCSQPPFLIDLDTKGGGCTTKTSSFLRVQNDRLLYAQLVVGAPTTSLFYGLPYRFGDWGGSGPGTFEDQPHGTVHAWVGKLDAQPPLQPLDDMGNFGRAAYDPVFYAHHANIDRLWTLWQRFPGGNRTIPLDSDFNQSQFTFYDENGNLVKMNVSQVLDEGILKYNYESLPTPWVTNGVLAGEENSIPLCSPLSPTQIKTLISNTPKHKSSQVLRLDPITFRVPRPKRTKPSAANGTEVLQLSSIRIPNITEEVHWKAFLFYPSANATQGAVCPEYLGTFNYIPHTGQAGFNPKRVWRAALGPKLAQIGQDSVDDVVVTLVQTSKPPGQNVTIGKVKIIYDLSPAVLV